MLKWARYYGISSAIFQLEFSLKFESCSPSNYRE